MMSVIFVIFLGVSKLAPGAAQEQPEAVRSSQRAPGEVRKPRRRVRETAEERKKTEQRTGERTRRGKCSTSFPGGDQVDGLPPAPSNHWTYS